MKKKKRNLNDYCPICDNKFEGRRKKTRHHIFPKWWYHNGLKVYACSFCHQREFHKQFPMVYREPWIPSVCVQNWIKFCKSKGKNGYEIYPELQRFESSR